MRANGGICGSCIYNYVISSKYFILKSQPVWYVVVREGGSEGVEKKGQDLTDHVPIAAGHFGISEAGWVIMLPTDAALFQD
ncbi:hypothetical protein KQX54_007042 [Cotesia glomerata]|uniref:Uncharacterized protein n=1 Tax=Cotesia glomerata TaxID=32391 RepID=A0AAV7I804_COTGL|nr:hypothetical protein KQX54_007042 [Cotesia glomerata]